MPTAAAAEPEPTPAAAEPEQPAAAAEPEQPAEVAPRARRRGRTTLLIATAAVLGLVAGTCAGFLIQADREPTKLPSLSQPVLAQAEGAGPEPLSAARDHRVKTDGDLRKLLVKRPHGSRDLEYAVGDDGWMDLPQYADAYEKPVSAFADLLAEEFRRAAVTGWQQGSTYAVEVRLVQFRQEETLEAADGSESGHYWAEKEAGTRSWPVPGTGDGMAYVHTRPDTKPGYLPVYSAEAHAWRGDIHMEIWIYDTKPIPKEKIMDLAERQMRQL
ncbi:hypothetical protein ABZZ47_31175 [Streptomyces sp. NPDC006465]|uniref:hypothetical protein n=1 Tax=Streptomyces sp. NPDC006465 TaxID=3157174 RepID=UPI0033B7B062